MGNREAFVVAFLQRSIYAGMQIVSKYAFDEGFSMSVFVFYRNVIGLLLLAPIAFVLERKTAPPLSFKVSLKLFVHTLFGISGAINIYSFGLSYTSATASSAILNLLPVVAFFLAVLLRMEAGILVSGASYYMQVWVIDKSGPVFMAMTMAITLLVTIMLSSFVLGEAVTLGSILGGVTMVAGLYCVLWAKRTEQVDDRKQQMAAPIQAIEL
ncbi:hypothetical protein ACP70R_037405 [Stipagrostis hirtigluma subsp. patula]